MTDLSKEQVDRISTKSANLMVAGAIKYLTSQGKHPSDFNDEVMIKAIEEAVEPAVNEALAEANRIRAANNPLETAAADAAISGIFFRHGAEAARKVLEARGA